MNEPKRLGLPTLILLLHSSPMRQFEIRDKRLVKVWRTLPNDITTNAGAIDFFKYYQEYEREGFLVLHTFETPAEADAARLDFIQANPLEVYATNDHGVVKWLASGHLSLFDDIRKAIDAARQAPPPKVTVIATPEGPVDPT